MPVTKMLSSIVYVGHGFRLTMFDERAFFDGSLDDDQVKVGPYTGHFSYRSKEFSFEIQEGRIELLQIGLGILQTPLLSASQIVSTTLEKVRSAITVSGTAMNNAAVFSALPDRLSGSSFCLSLLTPGVTDLIGANIEDNFTRVGFKSGDIEYQVQIEPELATNGANLYVAVNGYKNLDGRSAVLDMVEIENFRQYVAAVHERIDALQK